jgi:hypothetical protein
VTLGTASANRRKEAASFSAIPVAAGVTHRALASLTRSLMLSRMISNTYILKKFTNEEDNEKDSTDRATIDRLLKDLTTYVRMSMS